jgi:hypothetical protein
VTLRVISVVNISTSGRTNILLWDKDSVPSAGAVVKFNIDRDDAVLLVRERSSALFSRGRAHRLTVVGLPGRLFDQRMATVETTSAKVPVYVRVFDDGSVILATSVRQCAFDSFCNGQDHNIEKALGGGYKGFNTEGDLALFGGKIGLYQGSLPLHEATWEREGDLSPRTVFSVSFHVVHFHLSYLPTVVISFGVYPPLRQTRLAVHRLTM